jgi:hypothetical protein
VAFFLTLPLHLIPVAEIAVQKAAEEVVSAAVERKIREPYRWFYLLSSVFENRDETP